jgi:glycosyltransferase involved in cell wall biosynthesis
VVIKAFNHAAYVGEAIRSALDQSFQDFEIVVTDDGSRDGTADVIRQFTDPRISLEVSERNRGISIAMNSVIQRSRGEFVAILNSDDFFLPGKLAKQVQFLKENPGVAAVFGLARLVDDRGSAISGDNRFVYPFSHAHPTSAEFLRRFFFSGNFLCAPTAMVRRSAYADVGPYDPRLANLQDLDMWIRLCMRHRIHVIQEELTAFRVHDNYQNMSAPRRDTIVRHQFEYFQTLKHYRNLPADFTREIFADDLASGAIDTDCPQQLWLAEIALSGSSYSHMLFALDTMFDATGTAGDRLDRLVELTGAINLFNLPGLPPSSGHSALAKDPQLPAAPSSGGPSRNSPCPCGSGKKYKHCHGRMT